MLPSLARDLERRAAAVGELPVLGALASRLNRLLGPLTLVEPFIPGEKALLSRDGGVCPDDGSRLVFDPDAPFRHRCGRCGREVSGPRHHRAWIMRYQIWLSERAVHLALLGALGTPGLGARAAGILTGYAARYHGYPNEDNVLGPSRPFFSTYLESIWLVQLSVTLAMLEVSDPAVLGRDDREAVRAMLAESAALVASYDEGWSNRQVWNGAALLAAGAALDNAALQRTGMEDLRRLLGAVGTDGLWHEGENYHLFALRGFLLGAEVARWLGTNLYDGTALGAMYAAPLATLLPDLTLPARGDAPYGVSVAQPRYAEVWEIGRARVKDRRLDAVLAAIYAADLPKTPDHGRMEIAEQDEHRPAAKLERSRLGWKALLWMRPDDPRPGAIHAVPAILEQPTCVILRPDHETAVAIEIGPRRGGHGHPDRLHVSLFHGQPLLADFGTASYVDPSLHWYRSALAHNAPGRTHRGQEPAVAHCEGRAQEGPWMWCRVHASGLLGPGTAASRSLLLGESWLLDIVSVEADKGTWVDLPVHPLAGLDWTNDAAEGEPPTPEDAGHESGYDALGDVRVHARPAAIPLNAGRAAVQLVPRAGEVLITATAPGPPTPDFAPGAPVRFLIRRAAGSGRWTQLVSWGGEPPVVRETGEGIEIADARGRTLVVDSKEGTIVTADGRGVHRFQAGEGRRAPAPAPPASPVPGPPDCAIPLLSDDAAPFAEPDPAAVWLLGAPHYRRSELPHGERGGTRAEVRVAAQRDALWIRVRVTKPVVVIRAPDAPDPALDNETADIHADGVQVYVGRERWSGALVLPDFASGAVRWRPVAGTAPFPGPVTGVSRRTDVGYDLEVRLPTGRSWRRGDRVRFTVTVNEMVPGRERRSGQLAMAGGGWVWLRGDREHPAEAVEAEIA